MIEKDKTTEIPAVSGTSSVRIGSLKSSSDYRNTDYGTVDVPASGPNHQDNGAMNCTNVILQLTVKQQNAELLDLRDRVSVQNFILKVNEARYQSALGELKRTRSWLAEANRKIDLLTSCSAMSRSGMAVSRNSGIPEDTEKSDVAEWYQPNPLPRGMR